MFAAPSIFWLGPLIIVLADCPGICCVNTTIQFHRFTALGDYFCPAEYVDVEAQVTSKTKCLLHCEATPSCRNIGFEEDTFKCIKCSKEEFLENDAGIGSPAKTMLYRRHDTSGFWIGGNGTAGDIDSFKWLDGTWVSAGYSNWDTNDVVNLKGCDCMKMMNLTGYQWKNKDCGQTNASFCKFG